MLDGERTLAMHVHPGMPWKIIGTICRPSRRNLRVNNAKEEATKARPL
jgi:hypothetical protein